MDLNRQFWQPSHPKAHNAAILSISVTQARGFHPVSDRIFENFSRDS